MSWTKFLDETTDHISTFPKLAPIICDGFNTIGKAIQKNGAPGKNTKEFRALGIRIPTGCARRTAAHAKAMCGALEMTDFSDGSPSSSYGAQTLQVSGAFRAP